MKLYKRHKDYFVLDENNIEVIMDTNLGDQISVALRFCLNPLSVTEKPLDVLCNPIFIGKKNDRVCVWANINAL